ncbi:hypothetical protein VPH35_013659 [Triticum aestivum]
MRGEGRRRRGLAAAKEVLAGERAPAAAWRAELDRGASPRPRPYSRRHLPRRLPLLPTRRYRSAPPPNATLPAPRAPTPSALPVTRSLQQRLLMALAGPPRRLRVVHAVSQSAARGHASALPVALANPPRSLHVVPAVSPILNQGTRQESSVTRQPRRRSSISEPGDEFVNEEPVEYAYEDQTFDNSENLAVCRCFL